MHAWHEWFGKQTPDGQSVPVLQPCSQRKSGRQYWPVGQLSVAPGRHATHALVVVLHRGVAPPHCASLRHCTQRWLLQTPLGQSVFERQPTQVLLAGSHTGREGSWQSTFEAHCTHVPVAGLHTVSGAFGHCVPLTHSTHWPRAASHTRPDGHAGFCAEQPDAQVLLVHTMPTPHCESIAHATQPTPALHTPVGHRSCSLAQPGSQAPFKHTKPSEQCSSNTHATHRP